MPPPEDPTTTNALLVEPGGESPAADSAPAPGQLDAGLLAIFLVILAGIMASNLWLRRRAEREDS